MSHSHFFEWLVSFSSFLENYVLELSVENRKKSFWYLTGIQLKMSKILKNYHFSRISPIVPKNEKNPNPSILRIVLSYYYYPYHFLSAYWFLTLEISLSVPKISPSRCHINETSFHSFEVESLFWLSLFSKPCKSSHAYLSALLLFFSTSDNRFKIKLFLNPWFIQIHPKQCLNVVKFYRKIEIFDNDKIH